MHWTFKGEPITSLESIPKGVIGFTYIITFKDGTKYVGKKSIYSTVSLPLLKSGESRPNSIRFKKRVGGHLKELERVTKESNWKSYKGSSIYCKDREVESKEILAYAYNKVTLTYLELKYQCIYEVLETPKFLNDNILGKFYPDNLSL